jgi:RNA polymerase sigma-70 factor, ECF subfamily
MPEGSMIGMNEFNSEPSLSPTGEPPGLDPEGWVDRHGDAMFRFAMLRLRDSEAAAEVVQESFLHAFRSRASYSGRASERTWLVSILRNKIVDHFRRSGREPSTVSDEHLDEPSFDGRGNWRAMPARWSGHPSDDVEREEFWASFGACLSGLPSNIADAFLLREVEDLGAEDVCELLRITPVNLHTRLYRARMQLRECLERNWFGTPNSRKRGGP